MGQDIKGLTDGQTDIEIDRIFLENVILDSESNILAYKICLWCTHYIFPSSQYFLTP